MLRPTIMTAVILLVTALLWGCSQGEEVADAALAPSAAPIKPAEATPVSAAERVAQAHNLYDQSVELGFAWVATRKQIQAAETALKNGEDDIALTAANEAVALAEASIAQAETEAEAWQDRPPF